MQKYWLRFSSLTGGLFSAALATSALALLQGGCKKAASTDSNKSKQGPENFLSNSASDRLHEPAQDEPVFFFKALFANVRHSAFKYQELPGGAIRFFDATDKMEYVISQPFELTKGSCQNPLQYAASDAYKQSLGEQTKRYRITSYATPKGWRYATFKYEIGDNGSVRFWSLETKSFVALLPPYLIEEKLCGKDVKPDYGPDFTDSK